MKMYVFALTLCAAGALHAEPAVTIRATDLLAQAQSDAAKVAALPENTKVDMLRRVGAWSEVKSAAGQGWIRMMNLRAETAQGSAAPAGASGNALASLLNSGRTSNNATVTTGVKGLQEEDLQRVQPNPGEFAKMQKYAVSKDAGNAFAQRTKLSAAKVDYLQAPAPTNNNNGNNNNGTSTSGPMGL